MTRRKRSPWYLYALGLIAVGVIALAVTAIGPSSPATRTSTEIVTADKGVVQSTVSGSGNIQPGTDDTVNFGTSGTLQQVYVKVGQHVDEGQLLATLDPGAAELTLDQAKENLDAAELQLTAAKDGASSSGPSATSTPARNTTEFVSLAPTTPRGSSAPKKTKPKTKTPATTTTPASSQPAATTTTPSTRSSGGSRSSSGSSTSSGSSGGSTTTTNPATTAANEASAQASVYSAEAGVRNAQTALNQTKLYAPTSGTVVSLASVSPGQTVSGSGNSSSASSSSSTGTGTGTGTGGTGSTTSGSLGGSSSSSSSSSGSSSGFAEIVNTQGMTMTVAFDESDISKLKVGQAANVTLDALSGVELAAHVSAISDVATTSSSVVSYDVTLTLDQHDSRVKPGMSASAAVIVSQADGVTVPNAAITGGGSLSTVDVLENGKSRQQQVAVGLKGDSRTIIVSGLSAGQQLAVRTTLPSLTSSSGSSSSSGASGTLGGGGLGGAGFAPGAGGARAFFRGGGGP